MSLPRMRTIKETMAEIKLKDPQTALTEYALRKMIKKNYIPFVLAGNKVLINLDLLERQLSDTNYLKH